MVCGLSLLNFNGILHHGGGGAGSGRAVHVIAHGEDDLVHVDLAERTSFPQPRSQVLADPTLGIQVLAQQAECHPNGGGIPLDVAGDGQIFYEEPSAGFHELSDAFQGTLRVRELRVQSIS